MGGRDLANEVGVGDGPGPSGGGVGRAVQELVPAVAHREAPGVEVIYPDRGDQPAGASRKVLCLRPEGAVGNSPGRTPWVQRSQTPMHPAPKGRGSKAPPLRGGT